LSQNHDRHGDDAVLTTFLDGVAEVVSIGLKLRTRPTRGVDRVAEAQFRLSYENQRDELVRWMSDHLAEAIAVSPYEIAATLTDAGQDPQLDPKTRGMLVNLRKEYLETLPRAATPETLPDLQEALHVIGEASCYAPAALSAFVVEFVERIGRWPDGPREEAREALVKAIPVRSTPRGRPPGGGGSSGGSSGGSASSSAGGGSTGDDSVPAEAAPVRPREAAPPRPADTEVVLGALFATSPEAGREWADLGATMMGAPLPPADPDLLATQMSALAPQSREIPCKRMRTTLPDWCAACGDSHLRSLGRSATVVDTLVLTCRRIDADPSFREGLQSALPDLASGNRAATSGMSPGVTEAGLKSAGRLVDRLWDDSLGDAMAQALATSAHARPGAVRRLLTADAPRLAAHLASGGPFHGASWRDTLERRGVAWSDRLALPLARVPKEELLAVWQHEVEHDPATARGLLNVVREEAATSPEAVELLVEILDRQPDLTSACLEPLLAAITARPHLLQEKRRLARAVWDAVLGQPVFLAHLPAELGETLLPFLPASIPPTREWAAAFLRGPEWLRVRLRERHQIGSTGTGPWVDALLDELARGAIPQVPDPAAAQIAALLRDALRPETWPDAAGAPVPLQTVGASRN
jgi:hypothetical protein